MAVAGLQDKYKLEELVTSTFFLDPFALRQWEPNEAGSRGQCGDLYSCCCSGGVPRRTASLIEAVLQLDTEYSRIAAGAR